MVGNTGPVELLVILAILPAVFLWPAWRILSKMGYPGAVAICAFVPMLNILLLFFLAFSKWPIEREVERLRIGIK